MASRCTAALLQANAILLVAVLVAGCALDDATLAPPSAAPTTASPAPTATPNVTAPPSLAPTPEPTVNCAAVGANEGTVALSTPVGFETIDLQDGPLETPEAVDGSDVPIANTVVGGTDLTAEIGVGNGLDASTSITSIQADFLPFGTTTTLPVGATSSGSTASLRLPDRRVDGQLRFTISWVTSCGSGNAVGTIGLTVVPSSVTAGCPTTPETLADGLAVLGKSPHLAIGALSLPTQIVGWSGRWILGDGATDGPQFAGWKSDPILTVASGDLILIRESIADLALVSIQAGFFRRADVDAYFDGTLTDQLETVLFVRRSANSKGRANIPATLDPGSYVMEVEGSWLTSCLAVDTYNAVSVRVR
jgi:hypothetical protein